MAAVARFETPLLRVSRPVSACQRCKTAKVRCDGNLPACGACERAGRSSECSSANDRFARGRERSYVASLETRIERLEKDIAEAKARRGLPSSGDTTAYALSQLQDLSASKPGVKDGGSRSQKQEASNVSDLVSDFGFLSVNATARDFHGFTEQMSFARLILSASAADPMPICSNFPLPQRPVAMSLLDHYRQNVHILYPFLSETALLASLDLVYTNDIRSTRPMDHWVTRMMLAISLASKSRRHGDVQYQDATRHAAEALRYIETVVLPGSLAGIQAMLLLVLYSMFDPRHFRSWHLIGLASRAMVDIGMHQDPPRDSRSSNPQRPMAKRLYISIYALDR